MSTKTSLILVHPPFQTFFSFSFLPKQSWLKSWSTKWIVDQNDLSQVRDHFGEKVAYYFEFLQFYFQWLAAPTAVGVFVRFFGSSFSIFYGVFVILWSVVFTECWKRREKELALWWGVRHVSKTEMRRPSFKGETTMLDPVTGEMVPYFSPWKRWTRKAVGVPVVIGGALTLAAVITCVFGIEVFLTIYYDGYMKEVLVRKQMGQQFPTEVDDVGEIHFHMLNSSFTVFFLLSRHRSISQWSCILLRSPMSLLFASRSH